MADVELVHGFVEHNQTFTEPNQSIVADQVIQNSNHEGTLQRGNATGTESVSHLWPGWPGDNVFRMLVPTQKVGSIIGRKGELIKKIVEETRSRIKILDGPSGTAERVVMIFAKEEPDTSIPPAIDGLLRVHKRIAGGLDDDDSSAVLMAGAKVSTRLLVAATQAGSLIGRQGATVKSIQEASNCIVRVLGIEELPAFALQDDRVIEIVGEPVAAHKALELVASQLRKFLVDRSVIPLFEKQMQIVNHPKEHPAPQPYPWGPQGPPPNVPNPGYGAPPPNYMPPREHENYYGSEFPPYMDKQPHHGISAYGRESSMNIHMPPNPQPTQVTQHIQIPLSYADAVIGASGANISYIRRASGATVTIQETRGVPGEMTVEINGTASQVHMAQQFVQNFMAEGSVPPPAQAGGPADQGYNSYAGHASAYASVPPNQAQGGPPQGYGSAYGSNYGY